MFRPCGPVGETMLAQGPFAALEYRAVGDGTYLRDSGFFFATGAAGLAVAAAAAMARSGGNAARRAAAQADAMPRWVQTGVGELTVSTTGFYFDGHYWSWADVDQMTVTDEHFEMRGTSLDGPIHWTLRTPWAELVFVLWALHTHRQHPQLFNTAWLPPDYLAWVLASGYQVPRALFS